uniref:Uncharacterized protein n=1 Tax=Arion vulgaris TaxID=1028688 RepID=A0A0B6ZHU9_9EUPU
MLNLPPVNVKGLHADGSCGPLFIHTLHSAPLASSPAHIMCDLKLHKTLYTFNINCDVSV